jgi:hypothetical protein
MPQRPNGIKYDERYKMTTRNMQSLALVLSLSVSLAGCWGGKSSDEYLASARSYSEKGQNDAAIIELKIYWLRTPAIRMPACCLPNCSTKKVMAFQLSESC